MSLSPLDADETIPEDSIKGIKDSMVGKYNKQGYIYYYIDILEKKINLLPQINPDPDRIALETKLREAKNILNILEIPKITDSDKDPFYLTIISNVIKNDNKSSLSELTPSTHKLV